MLATVPPPSRVARATWVPAHLLALLAVDAVDLEEGLADVGGSVDLSTEEEQRPAAEGTFTCRE